MGGGDPNGGSLPGVRKGSVSLGFGWAVAALVPRDYLTDNIVRIASAQQTRGNWSYPPIAFEKMEKNAMAPPWVDDAATKSGAATVCRPEHPPPQHPICPPCHRDPCDNRRRLGVLSRCQLGRDPAGGFLRFEKHVVSGR